MVDVVANHMTSDWGAISQDIKNIPNAFHNNGSIGDNEWGDRWAVTQKDLLGLKDLNTQNGQIQSLIKDYLRRCVDAGVDGFRYDTAKHIELPSDQGYGSNFWQEILNNGTKYQYGEVLQDGNVDRFAEYSNYMDVTGSNYSKKIRDAICYNNISAGNVMSYETNISPNKLVTWVESHDTYANNPSDWGASSWMNDWQVKMAWAIVVSRQAGTPLFFSRPVAAETETDSQSRQKLVTKEATYLKTGKLLQLTSSERL